MILRVVFLIKGSLYLPANLLYEPFFRLVYPIAEVRIGIVMGDELDQLVQVKFLSRDTYPGKARIVGIELLLHVNRDH